MRVAWVTPLSQGSGISKYSLAVIPALRSRARVDVWAPRSDDDYPCTEPVRELRVDDETAVALADYDLVVYNTGNNPSFHVEIHRMSERVPGVVVVHDKRMHGFFFDLWAVIERDPARYAWMMGHYYSEAGEAAAARILSGRLGVDDCPEYPLIEPALWNATGIVVHSREAADLVSRYDGLVPVVALGLPFDLHAIPGVGKLPSRSELLPDDDGRLLLVSSGGVFEQKRLDSVLSALASREDLRRGVRFVIVGGGRPAYADRLESLICELGLGGAVTLTGRVDDRTMYGWLQAADIAVNLRYPSTESASLSLVEQMSFGVPVIVSDTSYYSELPDDAVTKVPVDESEHRALAEGLSALVADAALRGSKGRAASAFMSESHDPQVYVDRLMDFARELTANRETHT